MKTTKSKIRCDGMLAILFLVLGLMVSAANGDLTLPYHGITSTDGKAFWVSNAYSGAGMSYGGFFYAAGQEGRGVFGQSDGSSGMGVKGWAKNSGDVENYGGHFTSTGERGIGVYGWAENTGDVQNYGGFFLAEGNKGIGLFAMGGPNGLAGEFEGDVKISGAGSGIVFPDATRQTTAGGGGGAGGFPCPTYDSGWVALAPGESKYLYHNLGGNVENYLVDMQMKDAPPGDAMGIHNIGCGTEKTRTDTWGWNYEGAGYNSLSTTGIYVFRSRDDKSFGGADEVRIRIWVCGSNGSAGESGGGADSDWIISGNNMYAGISDSVGIGMTDPLAKLHVESPGIEDPLRVSIAGETKLAVVRGGRVGIWTTQPAQALEVNGSCVIRENVWLSGLQGGSGGRPVVWHGPAGMLGYQSSSARYKKDIMPLNDDFYKILQANPRSFTWKTTGQRGAGFIAEEFNELGLDNLVVYDEEGRPDALCYELISVYLLEIIKDQVKTTKQLKAENESLKTQLTSETDSLRQRVEALERTIQQQQFAVTKQVHQ